MSDPAEPFTLELTRLAHEQVAAGLSLEDVAVALLTVALGMCGKAEISADEVKELADGVLGPVLS